MSQPSREFRIEAVLSVYHRQLFCDFDEARSLLNFMTGHHIQLHDIPLASRLCARSLERQFVWLKDTPPVPSRMDGRKQYARKRAKYFGAVLPVKRASTRFKPRSLAAALKELRTG